MSSGIIVPVQLQSLTVLVVFSACKDRYHEDVFKRLPCNYELDCNPLDFESNVVPVTVSTMNKVACV